MGRRARARPGTVAVVGAGKMGLPLCRPVRRPRLARDRRRRPAGRRRRDQRGPLARRRGARSRRARRARPTPAAASGPRPTAPTAARERRRRRPDRAGHARRRAAARLPLHGRGGRLDRAGRPCRLARDLRDDAAGRRHARAVRAAAGRGVAGSRRTRTSSSRSRPSGCTAARRSATSRRIRSSSAGSGRPRRARAAAFYDAVLDTEIVAMSSAEAAEFSKLADTTYRDVNIALANEFARYAERVGVDIHEVIAAANSQPYSHIHQPGLGVGGHCIPVYPHFLLSRAPELELVELSRRTNDGQVGVAIRAIQQELGGLEGVPVLVLGLTYRHGVHELAYSRALPLIERLAHQGAVVSAYDPLLTAEEIGALRRDAVDLGRTGAVPGDRDPDRRSALRTARSAAWFPDLARRLRRPRQPPRPRPAGRRSPTAGSGVPPAAAAPAARRCRGAGRHAPASRWPLRIVSVVGTRPQLIKAAALLPALRATPRRDLRRHRPALGRGDGRRVLRRARACRGPTTPWGSAAERRPSRPGRMLPGDRGRPPRRATRRGARLRRHELDPGRRARRGQARHPGRPRRGRPAQLRPARCPRRSTGSSPTTRRAGCSRRRRRRSRTWPPRGSSTASSLVGDLMQDLAARVVGRGPRPGGARLDAVGARAGARRLPLRDGPPRREPRARPRSRPGRRCSPPLATPDRPVVLALHPGTRVRARRGGISRCRPTSGSIEPQGYRTTLALQLHAAAVLTDSGGVQREAAWLGVPCLVLRDRTEWVEAVATSGGRMVVVGLDAARASRSSPARARPGPVPRPPRARAASPALEPAGAAEAIAAGLG